MGTRKVSTDHVWVGAAMVTLDQKDAARAERWGTVVARMDTRLDVLEVYCAQCRKAFTDLTPGERCESADGNEHLIGGPTGERKKRKHDHDCRLYGCDPDIAGMRRAVGLTP